MEIIEQLNSKEHKLDEILENLNILLENFFSLLANAFISF